MLRRQTCRYAIYISFRRPLEAVHPRSSPGNPKSARGNYFGFYSFHRTVVYLLQCRSSSGWMDEAILCGILSSRYLHPETQVESCWLWAQCSVSAVMVVASAFVLLFLLFLVSISIRQVFNIVVILFSFVSVPSIMSGWMVWWVVYRRQVIDLGMLLLLFLRSFCPLSFVSGLLSLWGECTEKNEGEAAVTLFSNPFACLRFSFFSSGWEMNRVVGDHVFAFTTRLSPAVRISFTMDVSTIRMLSTDIWFRFGVREALWAVCRVVFWFLHVHFFIWDCFFFFLEGFSLCCLFCGWEAFGHWQRRDVSWCCCLDALLSLVGSVVRIFPILFFFFSSPFTTISVGLGCICTEGCCPDLSIG